MKRRLYPVVKYGARLGVGLVFVTVVFVLFGAGSASIKTGNPRPILIFSLYILRDSSALPVLLAWSAWLIMIAGIGEGNRARERGLIADQAAPKLSEAKVRSRLLTGGDRVGSG